MDRDMLKYTLWLIGVILFYYALVVVIILMNAVYSGEPLYPLYSVTGVI